VPIEPSRVGRYYASFDEWSRLDTPPGRLELLRALEIIDDIVPDPARILDLGGGPGRYALALARRGHTVTLADPSEPQLDTARSRAAADGVDLEIVRADARDLSRWGDGAFDVVVAFGPFYHLIDTADRDVAIAQIARVLRRGGLLLAQIIPRLCGLQGLIERAAAAPSHVADGALRRALEHGVFENASERGFPEGWYPTPEEARGLFSSAGFTEIGFESLRGIAAGREDALFALEASDPLRFAEAMAVVRATARDPAVVALGAHAVWIGRRS
jgi:S-adenosylmethionine-dependent methyltransferase